MKNIRNNSFDQDEPDFESDEVSIAPKKKRFFLLTPEDEQEKRQYRNLMIFVALMLILIIASVFFKPNLKEVYLTPKEPTELEKKNSEQGKKASAGDKKGMELDAGKEGGSGKEGGNEGGKEGTSSNNGESGAGKTGSNEENNGSGKFTTSTGSSSPQSVADSPAGAGEGDQTAMQTPSGPTVFLRDDRISKDKFNERKIFANLVNTSGKPLNKVIVVVKFLDHDKSIIHERMVNALVVNGGLFGDKAEALPDGEDRKISIHLDDLPKGWNGTYEIEIKTYE
ncbi:MAG: hypothetical protein G8345_07185 [Magnetococcales bacterium]|nr:hypothetical protein [Magnetococcales bacterium]NGZ26656.1 hypothetical protein [Magnetococcales bacterium]